MQEDPHYVVFSTSSAKKLQEWMNARHSEEYRLVSVTSCCDNEEIYHTAVMELIEPEEDGE